MQVPLVDLQAQYRSIKDEVLGGISEALEGMHLFLGPNVTAFEEEFALFCRAKYCVGVGSGTDALYLALRACDIGPGDEVITVSHTFFATAASIALTGATPVFVDVDPASLTLDPSRLDEAITLRTRAIVPVHLYGQMADMAPIMEVARRRGLLVVEDACQSHGAEDGDLRAGSIGDVAAFSFYMSKNLGAYGEAGAVTTNSDVIAARIRQLRDHGSSRKYEHNEIGLNSRLDELQAVVLRVKLRQLEEWNQRRRQHAKAYASLLSHPDIVLPFERSGGRHVYHLYVVRVRDRDRVRDALERRGIATGIHYPIPIHQQPAKHIGGRIAGELCVTEKQVTSILSLPMYPELEPAQLAYVADSLRACVDSTELP